MKQQTDYMESYETKWKKHVEEDGKLVLDKVARELSDATFIIEQYKKVLQEVTSGRISKIFTYAEPIVDVHDEIFINRMFAIDDIVNNLADENGKVDVKELVEYLSK